MNMLNHSPCKADANVGNSELIFEDENETTRHGKASRPNLLQSHAVAPLPSFSQD